MSLFTKPMRLLTAVVLEQKSDATVEALLKLGVMDFVSTDKIDADQLSKLSRRPSVVNRAVLEDMRRRVEATLRLGGQMIPAGDKIDIADFKPVDIPACKALLDEISKELGGLKDQQRHYNQKVLQYGEMKRYITERKLHYLDLRVGHPEKGSIEELEKRLSSFEAVLVKSSVDPESYVTLSLKRDAGQLNSLMDKFGWIETSDTEKQSHALEDARKEVDKAISLAAEDRDKTEASVEKTIEAYHDRLCEQWTLLRLNELCDQIKSYFSYTRNTTLFSGWVPAEDAKRVSDAIQVASEGQCVIEWTEASSVPREEVPVATTSPKVMLPFARMVESYGTPEYGTVNPTPFVMVTYLVMFALMFADIGQGAVLLLYGLIATASYKKHPMKKEGMINRNVAQLLISLGIASMVGGVMFGTCFGFEVPALWFSLDAAVAGEGTGSVNSVYGVLGVTIKFGIAVIYMGLILNWINLFRKRAWLTLLLDKNGIVGGALFATGLYLGFGFVNSGYSGFPQDAWIKPLISICVVLLLIRGFLSYFLSLKQGGKKKSAGQVVMDAVMEWLVDLLEIFSGYMSNTLSFMRVAGLGIAHVSLMTSFLYLSKSVGGGAAGVVIYILGNLLVIVLEGLSAGIQALRLNYYEFFSKYFSGKGVAYTPVSLHS